MKKLLIVDDNPNIRKMLRMGLSKSFDIEEAQSADEAYESLLFEAPDAMVLDVMMPGTMNGFQLCERIKDDPVLCSIYLVMVTACGQVAEQELGRALGADAYFVKPFSPQALEQQLLSGLRAMEERS